MHESYVKRKKEQKKFTPTRQIAFSFLGLIFVGSLLLTLPIANKGEVTSYINNLFIATSATCVTGLVPIVTSEQYSLFGQIVILILIQLGGLGFLTFLSVSLIKIRKKISLSNKLVMQEALNQSSLNNIPTLVRNIIKYTFIVEGIGALLLMIVFIPEYGVIKGFYYGIFHSISAFCNAGFDILGNNSLINYQTNWMVTLTICSLIILGGLGFIVWFDIAAKLKKEKDRVAKFSKKHCFSSLKLHSKLALITTLILIVSGTVIFYLCEMDNPQTIGGKNIIDQIQISLFQSTTLRTAGFASVDIFSLHTYTKMFMCVFMFIGGSPAGTAGGIKTVTFAVVVLMIYNIYKGRKEVTVFKRRIKKRLIIRSFAIFSISLSIAFVGLFLISITDNIPFIDLAFEIFSAFATVGLSSSVTPILSFGGKIIIIILMYIGRIGPITMIILFARKLQMHKDGKEIVYPDEDILLG